MDLLLTFSYLTALIIFSQNRKNPFLFPILIFSTSLILVVFGLVDKLFLGLTFVITAICLGLAKTAKAANVKNIFSGIFRNPANLFLLFGVLGSYAFTRTLGFHSWDEFSHWGYVVKATWTFDLLSPTNPAQIAFRSYPPSVTAFEYFITKTGGEWTESNVFWAYQIIIISLVYPFINRIVWKSKTVTVAALFSFAIMPITFFNSFTEITIDSVLGLTFGFTLALVAVSRASLYTTSILLSISLSFLTLIKDSGVYFAFVVLLYYGVKLFQERHVAKNEKQTKYLLAIATLGPVLAKLAWSVKLNASSVQQVFNEPIKLQTLLMNDNESPNYWNSVREMFYTSIFNQPIAENFTHFSLAVLLLTSLWFVERLHLKRERKKSFPTLTTLVALGAIFYTFGLLALYLNRFGEYEAVRLVSFGRYLNTFWSGVLFTIIAISFWVLADKPTIQINKAASNTRIQRNVKSLNRKTAIKTLPLSVIPILLISLITNWNYSTSSIFNASEETQQVRQPFEKVVNNAINSGVSRGKKVWIISQYSTGFNYWILRYSLLSAKSNEYFWSIGSKKNADDVWTQTISVEEWAKKLQGYDFVVIDEISPKFVGEFGRIFSNQSDILPGSVYSVTRNSTELGLSLTRTEEG